MQAFFKGSVVLLYFISRYFAEPIFVSACALPVLYGLIVCFILRFGGSGRMIAARDRAKKMVKKGVISGERRALFYKKCVKGLSPDARAAYALFLEGKTSGAELGVSLTRSVRTHGGALKGGMFGVGAISALAVFLVFYCGATMGEALLRTAICAFSAALNGVALHFILYASLISSEKAAEGFASIVDASVLREKREEPLPTYRAEEPKHAEGEEALFDLRSLLRELDSAERRR